MVIVVMPPQANNIDLDNNNNDIHNHAEQHTLASNDRQRSSWSSSWWLRWLGLLLL
jgi:hypothetical protein